MGFYIWVRPGRGRVIVLVADTSEWVQVILLFCCCIVIFMRIGKGKGYGIEKRIAGSGAYTIVFEYR